MKIFFITSNINKFVEARDIIGSSLERLSVDVPEIQAERLEDVVEFEIKYLLAKGYRDFILEDSGLFIEALRGFPGVYSSYVYKTIGCEGILKLMENIENRYANFICCIGGHINNVSFKILGKCRGRIATEIRGSKGFGYDPIFIPTGDERTFAEMTVEEKNRVSHRGIAFKKLRDLLLILQEDP